MKTVARHIASIKEKIKNLAVKGAAFSKRPNPNAFFMHLDVSIFFNICVENSSLIFLGPTLYWFSYHRSIFLSLIFLLTKNSMCFQKFLATFFTFTNFQVSILPLKLYLSSAWISSKLASNLLPHPIHNHMDISTVQIRSISNFTSPSHKSVSMTVSLLLDVVYSERLLKCKSYLWLPFQHSPTAFLLLMVPLQTSNTSSSQIAKFYRLVIWFRWQDRICILWETVKARFIITK